MTTINVDQIVSVTVVEKPISTYEWICKSTFLGITFVKEGVYNSIFKNYLGTEIPKGYRLINGEVKVYRFDELEFLCYDNED